jgi:hypothetical protein
MRKFFNTGSMSESANAKPPRGFTLCRAFPDLLIKLEQRTNKQGLFRVTYGLQVTDELTYAQACAELGQCILHALACNSELNNEGA